MAGESGAFNYSFETRPSPFALVEMYRDLADDMADFSAVWPRLGPLLGKGLGVNITAQGSGLGESWPGLSRPYARRKAKVARSGRPLVLTGETLRTLQKGPVVSSGPGFLQIGLRGKKWIRNPALNFGTVDGDLPRRAYMGFNAQMIRDTERLMGEHVEKVLDEAATRMGSPK